MKQFLEGEPQRSRDLFDIHQSHIPLSALDSTHIGTVKTTTVGEFFLRHPQFLATQTESFAESDANVVHLEFRVILVLRRLCVHGL